MERMELGESQSLRVDTPTCGLIIRVNAEGVTTVAYVEEGEVSPDVIAHRIAAMKGEI